MSKSLSQGGKQAFDWFRNTQNECAVYWEISHNILSPSCPVPVIQQRLFGHVKYIRIFL